MAPFHLKQFCFSVPFYALSVIIGITFSAALKAETSPFYVGHKTCMDCHKQENQVWEKTKHATSFQGIHKSPKANAILAAAGGEKNMRKNAICTQCHFTMEKADAAKPASAKSGPSCESCHGPASEWVRIHNNYGGPGIKKETETEVHKAQRVADAKKAGMIRPEMKYDFAANCMECHGLTNPNVDIAILGKILEAGHPMDDDFELVRYSQGSVRHRYNVANNAEMTPQELARLFVTGQAAKLVSASTTLSKSSNATYKAAQQKQINSAAALLSQVKSIPEAAALITKPTEENARKLLTAIANKDILNEVKNKLPDKSSYK